MCWIWDITEGLRSFLLVLGAPILLVLLFGKPVAYDSSGNGQDGIEYLHGVIDVGRIAENEQPDSQCCAASEKKCCCAIANNASDLTSL